MRLVSRTFSQRAYVLPFAAQRMSVALHMAAAWEVARELSLAGQLAGAEDEAALFGGEGSPTPLPKFSSYLARVRLGAV